MSDEERERFEALAYAYRTWPGHDPKGVVERFNELVSYVETLMEQEREWGYCSGAGI